MHDPDMVEVAVDLCGTCPVITDCAEYYRGMVTQPQQGVAHGHNYWLVRGRPRKVVDERTCGVCSVRFRVERGSTFRVCVGCRVYQGLVLGDISEVGRIARRVLGEGSP